MAPKNEARSFRDAALPYLTKTAHVSAPFITVFLLIHLSAPALANLGGSSLSSQTMLLGREYYQTGFGERYLLLAPLSIHVISASAKRILSPKGRPRRITNLLSMAGYATALLFLPIHYYTHRIAPANEPSPIFAVGPSELDYEFVKTGLQTWPLRSWFLYTGLVVSVTVHLADGMTIIWNSWFKDMAASSWKRTTRNRRLGIALTGIALPVLTGLYTLAREPPMTFTSIANRYRASLMSLLVYRV
ncbi:hypothetical protein B0H34DRAFT_671967 [Crassisporium funariophilum]|nr:hypothetical protein B0H34DRAFT_671967 [Crassisporium funariophilum]